MYGLDTLPDCSVTVNDCTASSPTAWQVQWCLHTLFYMLCDNKANQEEALRYPAFEVVQHCMHIMYCHISFTTVQAGIVRGLSLSWDGWKYNEARELVLLCQLHQYM